MDLLIGGVHDVALDRPVTRYVLFNWTEGRMHDMSISSAAASSPDMHLYTNSETFA